MPHSSLTKESFTAQNPFLRRVDAHFPEFLPGKVSVAVLHKLWSEVLFPAIAAAHMTYAHGDELQARPALLALFQALRTVCLRVRPTAQDAHADAGGTELHISSTMLRESEAQQFTELCADMGASYCGGSEDSDEETGFWSARHAGGSFFPSRQAADIVCYRQLAAGPTGGEDSMVTLVVDCKGSMQDWGTKSYQLLHGLTYAAQQNLQKQHSGDILGMCTSMDRYAVARLHATGLVSIGADGQVQQKPGDLQLDDAAVKEALGRVQTLPGCSKVQQLKEGRYTVGDYMLSDVHPFMALPFDLHPRQPGPGTNALLPTGYAALQGLLLVCAGQEACGWTLQCVDDRLQEWATRLREAQAGVHQAMSEADWADGFKKWQV